jgi:hypothetical protein
MRQPVRRQRRFTCRPQAGQKKDETMKNINYLIGSAVVGLIAAVAGNLRAQPSFPGFLTTETLDITLTARMQGDSGVDISQGNVTGARDTITTVRITDKDILNLIGAPAGSKLVLVNGATLGYRAGTNVTDTGIAFSIQPTTGNTVDKGEQTSTSTGGDTNPEIVSKSDYTGYYIASVSLDTSTNSLTTSAAKADLTASDTLTFQISGLATETETSSETVTAATKTSSSHSFSVNAAGEGTITGVPAIISGTITTGGSETASD